MTQNEPETIEMQYVGVGNANIYEDGETGERYEVGSHTLPIDDARRLHETAPEGWRTVSKAPWNTPGIEDRDEDNPEPEMAFEPGGANSFVDRNGNSVAADIRSGDYDEVLTEIEDAEDRLYGDEREKSVGEAIEERKGELSEV